MKGPDRTVNPLCTLAPRLTATLALATVVGASLFVAPQAAIAQRVQDLPTAAAGTHQSTSAGTAPAAGANPKAKAPAPQKLTPAQIQQEIQLEQAMAAQNAANAVPKTAFATRFPWLTHIFASIFLVSAVGLVLLLAFQTTKQEGLSGTIGGRVEAAYRPRLGFDQQLQRITSVAAITMVIFATIVSLTGI